MLAVVARMSRAGDGTKVHAREVQCSNACTCRTSPSDASAVDSKQLMNITETLHCRI